MEIEGSIYLLEEQAGFEADAALILPRKSVEGLFGYSGLWLWGDSKSSGDLYPRAECKRIRL